MMFNNFPIYILNKFYIINIFIIIITMNIHKKNPKIIRLIVSNIHKKSSSRSRSRSNSKTKTSKREYISIHKNQSINRKSY